MTRAFAVILKGLRLARQAHDYESKFHTGFEGCGRIVKAGGGRVHFFLGVPHKASDSGRSRPSRVLRRRADGSVGDVQEPIDDHAGNGHVEPDRVGPLRNSPMLRETTPESKTQSYEYEGQADDGQNRVRNQNAEIDWPDPSLAAESNESSVEMEIQIEAEENRGAGERGQHADLVRDNLPAQNEAQAEEEENSGRSVQDRVEPRNG